MGVGVVVGVGGRGVGVGGMGGRGVDVKPREKLIGGGEKLDTRQP